MPLSNIVVVVIRLFVLDAILVDLGLWLSTLARGMSFHRSIGDYVTLYGGPVLMLVLIYWMWKLAPNIARLVTRGFDAPLNLPNLTRADLYQFAFVFLGLLYVLRSLADSVNWLHYMATTNRFTGSGPQLDSFYQFSRPLITLGAGLIALLGAPRWARKLLAYEEKIEGRP